MAFRPLPFQEVSARFLAAAMLDPGTGDQFGNRPLNRRLALSEELNQLRLVNAWSALYRLIYRFTYRIIYRIIYRATYRAIYRATYRLTLIFTGLDNSIRGGIDSHHDVAWLTRIDGILGLGTAVLTTLPNDLINAAPPGFYLARQVDATGNRRIRRT